MLQQASLYHCCQPMWQAIQTIKDNPSNDSPSSLTEVREIAKQALHQSETACVEAKWHPKKIFYIRFAFIALIDEKVIETHVSTQQWFAFPLQLEILGENNAGERFYQYLDELRLNAIENIDVLEVYYQCLMMGFKGKYTDEAQRDRQQLCSEVANQIFQIRPVPENLTHIDDNLPSDMIDAPYSYKKLAGVTAGVFLVGYLILQISSYWFTKNNLKILIQDKQTIQKKAI